MTVPASAVATEDLSATGLDDLITKDPLYEEVDMFAHGPDAAPRATDGSTSSSCDCNTETIDFV